MLILRIPHQLFERERPKGHLSEVVVHLFMQNKTTKTIKNNGKINASDRQQPLDALIYFYNQIVAIHSIFN